MGDSGIPLVPDFQQKGEGGKGEDENRDGCWSQREGWVLGRGERVGGWVGAAGGIGGVKREGGEGGGGGGGSRGKWGWQGVGVVVGGGWHGGESKEVGRGRSKGWMGCSFNLGVDLWVNQGLSDWFQILEKVFG